MSLSFNYFMEEVKLYDVLSTSEERQLFTSLAENQTKLIENINKTAVLYNRIPGLLLMLADGYEAVKNIVQTHQHELGNKQLTEFIIDSLESYQHAYQQKVIHKKDNLVDELNRLTLELHLDPSYITELANEARMYVGDDPLVEMHMTSDKLYETQFDIASIMRSQEQLTNKLTKHNLKLVVSCTKKLHRDGFGIEFADLVQEGNIALLKAIQRFDVSTGNKFSTMATYWINAAIQRFMQNHGRTIRVPVNVQDQLSRVLKAEDKLRNQLKRQPTDREITTFLGISNERLSELRESNAFMSTLDAPAGNDEDNQMTLADIIADAALSADVELYHEQVHKHIQDALETLTNDERDVIVRRHGFDGGDGMSLGECAYELNVSKTTILNRENKALLKLHRLIHVALRDQ